jgi:hypothetical protein
MTDTDLFSHNFRKFLVDSGFSVEFEIQPSQPWKREDILLAMMIAIRSQEDVLSGVYSSYEAFITHISTRNVVEDLISQRGVTVDEDLFDQWNALCSKRGTVSEYTTLIPRVSRHIDHCMGFMKAHGLRSQEDYLLTRGWFCRSAEIQRMTLQVVLRGDGRRIDVKAPDYREHITSLLPAT